MGIMKAVSRPIIIDCVYLGAAFNVTPANTWVPLPLDTEMLDLANGHSLVSNTSRLNLGAVQLGEWLVGCGGVFLNSSSYNAGNDVFAGIFKNALTLEGMGGDLAWSGAMCQPACQAVAPVQITSPSDYVEAYFFSDATATTIIQDAHRRNRLWAIYQGPIA